ncbi:MAG TPA: tripartite tricarboxylate transporter substrate-binding protein [Xanthobacteraceae bacterium]|nr:tripartite tricarboxylate transporter substrate-binding protein [Xanthobacteraceae bacterium]
MRCAKLAALLAAAFLAAAAPAAAQQYPQRAITIVVPFAAGGPTDVLARVLGDHMSRTLGQPVIVEDVTGAGGTIGATRVAKAAPDGYTLVLGNIGTHAASVGLYKNLVYDPRTSFEPIMVVATTPMVLTVKKDLAVKTLPDVVALAKQRRITMGSAGTGSSSHLTLLLFQSLAGVQVQHVPYRGLSQAENDLLAGQIETLFDQVISASPQILAGGVKPIVVTAPERAKAIPNVPTAAEAGMPDLITITWTAMFAPKGTPQPIIAKLNHALDAAMRDPALAKRLDELGADLPKPGDERRPEYLGKLVASEVAKWTPLIRAAGVAQ